MSNFDQLRAFRHKVYTLLGNGRAALFDLMDAVLVSRSVSSFAALSLSPVFRRRWSSLYEAVQDSQPPCSKLMTLYVEQLQWSPALDPHTAVYFRGTLHKLPHLRAIQH